MFDQSQFNSFVLDNEIVGFFDAPVTLKSGRTSFWYVNWRKAANDAFLMDVLSNHVLAFAKKLIAEGKLSSEPLSFYGVPEGATKLGVMSQFKWAKESSNFGKGSHPLPMGRAKPKPHGVPEDKFFVGAPVGPTLLLEDTTTTGGSLLTAIDGLLEAGVDIIGAVGLTNRMETRDDGLSVEAAVNQKLSNGKPIPYFSLSNALELLPEAVKRADASAEVQKEIIAEFKQWGVSELSL